jgi:Transposase DDE domain
MCKVADLAVHVQTLFADLAAQAVHASGLRRRRAPLGGPAFVRALVFASLAEPDPTLDDYAQAAAGAGAPVSPQAIDQRFGPASADCLRRLVEALAGRAVAGAPAAIDRLSRFAGVHVQDATLLPLPDDLAADFPGHNQPGQRAALKAQVRLELAGGAGTGLALEAGRTTATKTALTADDLPAGALRLADLGYFDLEAFAALAGRGVYWLSRYQASTAVFVAGTRVELADWLPRQAGPVVQAAVELGVVARLAARLVAGRVPAAVADRRRQRVRVKAAKKGRTPSAEQLALCDWTTLVTNVPAELASPPELAVLYRARWQIEILFRVWKSAGGPGRSRSARPWRVATETFAKLAALLLRQWLLVAGACAWLGRSGWRTGRGVRRHALTVLLALPDAERVRAVLTSILGLLARAARVERRRKQPSTLQLLKDPALMKLGLA